MSDATRPMPAPDIDTAFYWEAASRSELAILRCRACGTWIHYPKPRCRSCGSTDLAPETTSGRGTVYSYTVTHRAVPGFEPPFVVALIELDEQPGLRIVSNLPGTDPSDVRIGMRVEVTFERHGDVTLPQFRPAPETGA